MSLRSRSNAEQVPTPDAAGFPPPPGELKPTPTASSQPQALSQALAITAHLANLLPTGTLLAFQLLAPVLTHHGACNAASRALTRALLSLLGASCFLFSFTDSFRAPDGSIYYGVATRRGLWLLDYPTGAALPDLSRFRLRAVDFVHAAMSVLVFGVVAMRDADVVGCLYPNPGSEAREVIAALPMVVGVMCGMLFAAFPTRRHGIGYPVTGGS